MHIAYLTSEYPSARVTHAAGIATSIKNLAVALVEKGVEVSVIVYHQKEDAVYVEHGVTIHLIQSRRFKSRTFYKYRKFLQNYLNDLTVKEKIDIIEAPDWTGITAFMRLKAPLVIRFHGSDAYFCKLDGRKQKFKNFLFEKLALRQAKAFIAPTAFAGKETAKIFGLNKSKIKTIHYGLQLDQFINLKVSEKAKAPIIKDMFIFSVFGGGLRFSDVLELRWKDYNEKENKITKVIRKTGRQHSFKIGQTAIEILNKYKTQFSSQDDIIFPFANIGKEYFTDREHRAKVIHRSVALSGQYLRKMGKDLELPFSLTFHISRHTFATRALNNGMRIEHVSKLMDHTNISITQVYAKIISTELDNAVDKYIN